jgi:hypothetical protein
VTSGYEISLSLRIGVGQPLSRTSWVQARRVTRDPRQVNAVTLQAFHPNSYLTEGSLWPRCRCDSTKNGPRRLADQTPSTKEPFGSNARIKLLPRPAIGVEAGGEILEWTIKVVLVV